MTQLERVILRLEANLRKLGVRWALVGGVAVSLRARPRTTFDVDIAVAVADDREAERIVYRLIQSGWTLARGPLEHEITGRMVGVRLNPPPAVSASASVDLLFASSGIEDEVVGMAGPLEAVRGFSLPVARVGHLIALKVLSESPERPHDREDALQLLLVASAAELELARSALDRVERRGYHRGKDLHGALAELVSLAERRTRRRQS